MPPGRPKGGPKSRLQNSVKNNSPLKNTKPSVNISSPEDKQILIDKPYKCTRCGTRYSKLKGNFSASQSPLYAGNNEGSVSYLPICRKCLDELFNHYAIALGDEKEAVKRICIKFDIYFNELAYESAKKISADRSRITGYISKVNIIPHTGKTYDDTIDEEQSAKIETIEDFDELKESGTTKISANIIKQWGFGFAVEDYEYLNAQFGDWKSKCIVDGKARESLVRELCIIKLQQNKALFDGKVELYDKLTQTYQKVLANANLQPKQEDANDKAGEKPMGVMIEMFENERPIPPPEDEWINNSMIRLVSIYFLGHLSKMVGIKNRYANMYEEEMAKYRVELPEFSDAEDDDIFEYLSKDNNENEDNIISEIEE